MDTIKDFRARLNPSMVAAVLVAALFVALTLFAFGGGNASAGGGDGDGKPGIRVAEGSFTVNVEPIRVEFEVIDGYPYSMQPGGRAMLGVKISNLSKTTDWDVVVEIKPDLTNSPYQSDLMTMAAYWDNGTIFQPGQAVLVRAGKVRALAIAVSAMNAAGTEEIQISVYRLPKTASIPTPTTNTH